MDVQIYAHGPKDGPKPKNAPAHELGADEPWSDAPQLGGLATIFEQDMGNLPYVQEGLHASGTGWCTSASIPRCASVSCTR
jgi:hypothetical protein